MFLVFSSSMVIFSLSGIIMGLASLLSKKTYSDREKNSPFECGFDPKSSPRLPFSLRFFLIAVIFLVFDVEIVILLPMMLIFKSSSFISWMLISSGFIMILLVGLFHEWNQGMLAWSY